MDSSSNTRRTDIHDDPQAEHDSERQRLIEDLAYLVVRQHRYEQRAAAGSGPTMGDKESEFG